MERAVDETLKQIEKVVPLTDEQRRTVRNRLMNSGVLSKLVKK
jgi:hypothetical protein